MDPLAETVSRDLLFIPLHMPPANATSSYNTSEHSQHSMRNDSSQPEEYEIDHQLLARYERLNQELEQMSRLQRSRQRNHSWDQVDSTRGFSRTMSGIFSSRGLPSSARTSRVLSSRGLNFSFRGHTPSERSSHAVGNQSATRGGIFSSSRGGGSARGKVEIPSPYEEEWTALSKELEKARKSCIEKRAAQSDLLEKIEKYETSAMRRIFAFNKEKRVEKLKLKLCKQLKDAEDAEESLSKLERRSMTMSEVVHHLPIISTNGFRGDTSKSLHDQHQFHGPADPLDQELLERQDLLEQEKREILNNVFNAFVVPDVNRLKAHIAVAASELKAGDSIKKQVDEVYAMYRTAFTSLRSALTAIVGKTYKHSMKEFIQGPYPLAIEAGRLVEGASLLIQPEAKRKYPEHAPMLMGVQLPKFPTSMKDLARPGALLTMDASTMESADMERRLKRAESVIVKTQQLVNRNLECLEQWRAILEKDRHQAETTCRALEAQLEKKMTSINSDQTPVIRGYIRNNLLAPGEGKLYCKYQNQVFFADVHEDGTMVFRGNVYHNVLALSLEMKRTINPSLRSDQGWGSLYLTDSNQCLRDVRDTWIDIINNDISKTKANHKLISKSNLASILTLKHFCVVCKREKGMRPISCDSCHDLYHAACIPRFEKQTTPWYCDKCIEKHRKILLVFLQRLRTLTARNDESLESHGTVQESTLHGALSATNDVSNEADPSANETNHSDHDNNPKEIEISALNGPKMCLRRLVNDLILQLEQPSKCLDVLTSSTGEVLTHLNDLNMSEDLKAIDFELFNISQKCCDDHNESIAIPSVEGILQVLNLRHGIMSSRYHLKRTASALKTLTEKRLRSCDMKEKKIRDVYDKERLLRDKWVERMNNVEQDVATQHVKITHINALIDNAVRHRKTLRAECLANRFIPAYRHCMEDAVKSGDDLFLAIIADKLKGIAKAIKGWEEIEIHYAAMKNQTTEGRSNGIVLPHFNLPLPPSKKIYDRQLNQLKNNMDVIKIQKQESLATIEILQKVIKNKLGDEMSMEWHGLINVLDEMATKCKPTIEIKQEINMERHPIRPPGIPSRSNYHDVITIDDEDE